MFSIISSTPSNEADDVDPEIAIRIKFSGPIDAASVWDNAATLNDADGPVPITLGVAGDELVLRPRRRLAPDRDQTVRVSSGISSTSGELLPHSWKVRFRTAGPAWKKPVYAQPISTPAWGSKTDVDLVLHDDDTATLVWIERDATTQGARLVASLRSPAGTFGPREVLATGIQAPSGSPQVDISRTQLYRTGDGDAVIAWKPSSGAQAHRLEMRRYRPGTGWSPTVSVPIPNAAGASVALPVRALTEMTAPGGLDVALAVMPLPGNDIASAAIGRIRWASDASQPTYDVTLQVLPAGSPALVGNPHATDGQPRRFSYAPWRDATGTDRGLIFAYLHSDSTQTTSPRSLIAVTYSFSTGILTKTTLITRLMPHDVPEPALMLRGRPDGSATLFFSPRFASTSVTFSEYSPQANAWSHFETFFSQTEPNQGFFSERNGAQFACDEAARSLVLGAIFTPLAVDGSYHSLIRGVLYSPQTESWTLTGPVDPHFELGSALRVGQDWLGVRVVYLASLGRFVGLFGNGWAASFGVSGGWDMPQRVIDPAYYGHHWWPKLIAHNKHGRALALWRLTHTDVPAINDWYISEFS